MGSNGHHPPVRGGDGTDDPGKGLLKPWTPGPAWQARSAARSAPTRGATSRVDRRRLRWAFAGVGAALLALAWVIGFSSSVGDVGPSLDPAYVDQAAAVCAPVKQRLRQNPLSQRPSSSGEELDDGARAAAIDRAVGEFEGMVEDLRTLPPEPDDRDEVERWLADWDVVLASGRSTARALRTGDIEGADSIGPAERQAVSRVNGVAVANGFTVCSAQVG